MFLRAITMCLLIGGLHSNLIAQEFELEPKKKSPIAAFTISAASTAIPFFVGASALKSSPDWVGATVITTGLIAGPSMGYLYSGDTSNFKTGLFTRSLATGLIALGGVDLMIADEEFEEDDWDALSAIIAGTGILGYSIVSDWFGAAKSAKRFNEGISMRMSPGYHFETGTPTLNLRISF